MRRESLCLWFALSAGCATSFETVDDDHDHDHHHEVPVTAAMLERGKSVKLLNAEDPGQPTEVLGLVDVHSDSGHQEEALAELRARAAAIGAEAVTGVEFHHAEGGGNKTHLSGTAVRFRDLIRGRSYDVIADLDVKSPMGHEDDALEQLEKRAWAMRADLIIGIRFEHGDGEGGGLHLVGKAIQFKTASR